MSSGREKSVTDKLWDFWGEHPVAPVLTVLTGLILAGLIDIGHELGWAEMLHEISQMILGNQS